VGLQVRVRVVFLTTLINVMKHHEGGVLCARDLCKGATYPANWTILFL